ncbi:MAG: hypothetical protein EYC70_05420 [Planctomycetota bacterium]|nr:MAG: hypothetical protein EYC70_05420 [Planctomycetota bacterium]
MTLAAALALAAAPQDAPPLQGTLVVRAARIWHDPGAAQPYLDDAWLVVRDGRVVAVTSDAAQIPPFAPVLDFGDAVIVPGLVAADSALTGAQTAQRFGEGQRALGADRRALDEFDAYAEQSAALGRGLTSVYLSPPRMYLVGGRGAVVKLAGAPRVLLPEADLRVSLAAEAANPPDYFRPPIPPTSENPLRPAEKQPPTSRAGALLVLRETAAAARGLAGAGAPAWDADSGTINPGAPAHLRALAEYLQSKAPLRVAADSSGEVAGALDLAAAWQVPLVIVGGREAGVHAERLARAGAVVVFEAPLFQSLPELGPDWKAPEGDTLARLRAAGVPVAVSSGRYAHWSLLLEAAAAAMAYGLDENDALAAVTSSAARALGVGDRVGALRPGCDADFVVLQGAALAPAGGVQSVYVAGVPVWDQEQAASAAAGAAARRGDVEGGAPEQAVILRAGTLWTGDGPPLRGGAEVLLRNGRVEALGASVPRVPGARVLDAGPEAHLTPGLIDLRGVLGLGPQNLDPQATLGALAAGSRTRADWQAVARGGVTSMVIVPRTIPGEGARVQVLKTAAEDAPAAYIAERELVYFNLVGGDRAARAEELRKTLERGKGYFEQWEQWRAKHAQWAQGKSAKEGTDRDAAEAALRERLAQGEKKEEKKEEVKEEKEEGAREEEGKKEVDPINGLWEAEVEDARFLPEPVTLHARLHHEGEKLKGVFSSPDFEDQGSVELDGTYDAAAKAVRFQLETQFGTVGIQGTVDAPDHMLIRVEVAAFGAWEFEANRIEVEEAGAAPVAARKARKPDDEPPPPKRDWRLEAIRTLFEQRAVAMVLAERPDEIQAAVELFGSFKIPVHVVGGGMAHEVADLLRERNVGVVLGPDFVRREENREYAPAAELRARGVRVAFQSAAATGARFLPNALALAARSGLAPEQALEGLTSGAARMLGLEQRIGVLAPGCDGDVVLWSGPPLDLRSRVITVFVNGKEVPEP